MSDPSIPSPAEHGPSFGPLPRGELLALLRADQRRRWRRGERVAVEAYPDRLPFLRDDIDALLDLVVGEIELREERGEPFTLEEYQTRFPVLAGPLVWRLALHRAAAGSVLAGGTSPPATVPTPEAPPQAAAAPAPPAIEPEPPPPVEALPEPAAERPATPLGRVWGWCRHHPAGVLTAAAAALLIGTLAGDFTGRANPTALPAAVDSATNQEELKQARSRADRAERELAAARVRADALAAARDEAVRLRAAAEDAAARAAERDARDRKVLDGVLADLIDRHLLDGRDANPVRDRLLALAQTHYEAGTRDRPDDPARASERGRALVRLARIAETRGDAAAAIGHLRQAVESLSADEAGSRPELADAWSRLGELHRRAGQFAEAEAAGRRAVELWEKLAAETDGRARGELARACASLADSLAAAGKAEESTAVRRRAVDLLRQLPEDARHVEGLARNAGLLGDASPERDPASAAEWYTESAAAWERLARLRPLTDDERSRLAGVLLSLASAQERLGQADAADRTMGRALEVRERLAAEHHGEPSHRLTLALGYVARGERRRDRNRDDEAAADFRRAAPLLEELARKSPQDTDLAVRLAVTEMGLAQIDLRRRRVEAARAGYRQALARLDELDGWSPGSADVAVDRGVCCVNLGQLAAMDGKAKEARDWFDRAEGLLKPQAEHPRLKDYVAAALADCARGRAQAANRPKAP